MSLEDWEISEAVKRIRDQIKARHRELVEMEQRAGIHEKVEALRDEPPNYFAFIGDVEWDSDERRGAETAAEEYHSDRTLHKIRELYFSVADVELRKALIAKYREEEEARRKYWLGRLSYEAREAAKAEKVGNAWWFWASVLGVMLIVVGAYVFGWVGGIAGLLVGYFCGRNLEQSVAKARQAAIVKAADEVKEAQEDWEKTRNEPMMFSRWEAREGAPEPKDFTNADKRLTSS